MELDVQTNVKFLMTLTLIINYKVMMSFLLVEERQNIFKMNKEVGMLLPPKKN